MSLSFSSCRVVFTSLIFILISFCLFCDMINSGIIKALIVNLLEDGLDGWFFDLWGSHKFFVPRSTFHGFIKHVWDTSYLVAIYQKKYYYFSCRIGLPCWDAIIVLAMLLLENVTLIYVTVSIPSTSSQHGFRVLLSLVH